MQTGSIQAWSGGTYYFVTDTGLIELGNIHFAEMYKKIAELGFKMTANEFVKE